jgi:CubicO group peptidase (beta-lactamase class C family)
MDGPLDDTVPAEGPVTVRGLLTFTFGFGMAAEMFTAPQPWPVVAAAQAAGLATLGPPQPSSFAAPETWIARFGELPLLAQPGQRWLYNTGAHVLSVLCARAAGTSYEEVLHTRIFGPLGMRDTGFHTGDTGRLATAYQATAGGLVVWDPPDGQWSRPPAFPDGAAGLVSTADDLLAFGRMLLRGGDPVLTAGQVREMSSDHLTAAQREDGDPGRPRLGAGHIGGARRAVGRRHRLGRRARHIVPGAPGARPHRDRADPAAVRDPASARRTRRPASRRPRRGRVNTARGTLRAFAAGCRAGEPLLPSA